MRALVLWYVSSRMSERKRKLDVDGSGSSIREKSRYFISKKCDGHQLKNFLWALLYYACCNIVQHSITLPSEPLVF